MAKQVIHIAVDVPEGWEATGEWRKAVNGEYYIGWPGKEAQWLMGLESPVEVFILRKVEPVRESRWINLYGADSVTASVFSDRDACDRHSSHTRKAVLRIDYENARPVSATVEGVE
jgi:hypothetical protein